MHAGPRAASRSPPSVPERLKRRADFRAAAKGVRVSREAFTLQAVCHGAAQGDRTEPARVGFTVTKRVGNAVVRNRVKRRLRALSQSRADEFTPGTDYVLVARRAALTAPFADLEHELDAALRTIAAKLNMTRQERA